MLKRIIRALCIAGSVWGGNSSAIAQSAKELQYSFMGLSAIVVPHNGLGSDSNQPLFLGYQDLTLEWFPWLSKNKEHQFRFRVLATEGDQPSTDVVGDIQVFSNIEAGNHIGLFEAYYQHCFNQNHILLVGQSDLCSNFVSLDAALWFTNSSFGAIPTLSLNHKVPIFPLGAPGVVYNYRQPNYRLALGVYDGNVGDWSSNKYNLNPSIGADQGVLAIGQAEIGYSSFADRKIIAGVHYHIGDQNVKRPSAYLMVQHGMGYVNDEQPAYQAFAQLGVATEKEAFVSKFVGAGLVRHDLTELLEGDVLGLALAHARIGSEISQSPDFGRKSETTLELFAEAQIIKRFFLHPSFSYIVNTGARSSTPNICITSLYLRFEL